MFCSKTICYTLAGACCMLMGFGMLACFSLLKGADELCIRKPVKSEYGGGNKEFVFEDQHFFVDSDNPTTFFASQERQSIVRHMLFSLRAHQGDAVDKIQFLEGQAIGMMILTWTFSCPCTLFSMRCNIYILRLCYDVMSVFVCPSVCKSVCDGSAFAHYS